MNDQKERPGETLRRLAQNDYMIDGKLLPDGKLLTEIADQYEAVEKAGSKLALAAHQQGLTKLDDSTIAGLQSILKGAE